MSVFHTQNLGVAAGERQLLSGGNLRLDAGGVGALVGATGSGKSVVLRALCGLHPCTGRIVVEDVDHVTHGMAAVQQRLGVLLSSPGLLDDLTVFENVAHRLRRAGVPPAEVNARVEHILLDVGLQDAAHKLPGALSGGMQRRVALARALVHRPPCVLLDDPTAGLDPITSTVVLEFILETAHSHGAAVLLTTHDVARVAVRAHQVWLLAGGTLRAMPPDQAALERELGA